jgi:CPA2 family monovalent cation:H+ antiporter-2
MSSKFILPLVENSKFENAIAALITIIVIVRFYGHYLLRRVAVKVEILYKERKYRGPILMLIFKWVLLCFTVFY